MGEPNDNGAPTWQDFLHEQTYGTGEEVIPVAEFDPGDHTVAEVQQYIADHPDEQDAVLEAEAAGKNRSSLTGA